MKKLNIFFRKHKKLIALFLVATFLVSLPYAAERVYGTSAQDKKEEAEENLKDVEDQMNDIKDKQEEVEGEIKDVRKKLSSLMTKQNELKSEISGTQAEIEQTQAELEVARVDAQEQYEAMKIRIKFMYENSSNDSMWTAIFESDGIADMLNRVEYISTIYKADRELTEQYKATVAQIEEKEELLLVKMDELLMKQETFLGQQMEIESMIASLEDAQNEFAAQLASAKKQAEAYKKTIKEQEEIIRQQQAGNSNSSYPGGKNVSGETLVNYALQFVGNPYVWGGNSLTKGCDCSGFVHQVYKYFGYNLVRYSLSFLYEGVPVSKDEMKPGDIVVYPRNSEGIGHVAIYIGNGKIVEAQSTKAGITSNRPVFYKEPLGIRRVLPNP
ncbi:MAG: C40 family peptidase [Agathobacter sp.]|nr:C40 family peptidase [Agathobacter sp.]